MQKAVLYISICLALTLASCEFKVQPHNGIVLGKQFGKIQNGAAYDTASIDITTYAKLRLPATAEIQHGGAAGKLEIFMEKTLGFVGHPPEPMNIKDARKNMGCACRVENDVLQLATFGEWDSHIEGGASMKLLLIVPDSIEIETDDSLSGENSQGREWSGDYLAKPKDVTKGYWYGPASPASGWTAIRDVPDTNLTLYQGR